MHNIIISALLILCTSLTVPVLGQSVISAYLTHNDSLQITLLKKTSNYTYADMHPCATADGKYLYFSSQRGGNSWSFPYENEAGRTFHLADIYRAERTAAGWGKAEAVPFGLNSSQADHSPVCDGEDLYFVSFHPNYADHGGPFFKSNSAGHVWSPPVGLAGPLTAFFVENGEGEIDGFTFGPDKAWMIFSWGKKGMQKDLYISVNQKGKGWGTPLKMAVSTPHDDRAPYLLPGGNGLLFSTVNLEEGFGGYDLVMVRKKGIGFGGGIINLSEPFNSEANETGFSIAPNGRTAFLVRDGMLYEVSLMGAHPYLRGE